MDNPGTVHNVGLAGKVLFFSADAEIDTGDFHGIKAKMGILKLANYKSCGQ